MIREILLVLLILYILCAIYFGLLKRSGKFKIFRAMFKILVFVVLIGIAIALVRRFY